MRQRGCSVVTYVRYGEKVYSPVIDRGKADVILSFEKLEAARSLSWLKPEGLMITNTQEMEPMPVITGAAAYPENLVEKMRAAGARVTAKDFLAIAMEAGSPRTVNVALIGCLSTSFAEIPEADWLAAIDRIVPEKFRDLNKKAFALGRHAGQKEDR